MTGLIEDGDRIIDVERRTDARCARRSFTRRGAKPWRGANVRGSR